MHDKFKNAKYNATQVQNIERITRLLLPTTTTM